MFCPRWSDMAGRVPISNRFCGAATVPSFLPSLVAARGAAEARDGPPGVPRGVPVEPVVQDVVPEERRVVVRGEPQGPDELAVLDVLTGVPNELPDASLVLDAAKLPVWVPGEPEAPGAVLAERMPEFEEPVARGVSPGAGPVSGAEPSSCFRATAVAPAVADWARGVGSAAVAVAGGACFPGCDWPVLPDAGLAEAAGRVFEVRAVALP